MSEHKAIEIPCWYHGRMIDLAHLDEADIKASELAEGLHYKIRFGGESMSNLAHSLMVAFVAANLDNIERGDSGPIRTSPLMRAGLLHDCHEIWSGDCVGPARQWCGGDRGELASFDAYVDGVLFKQFRAEMHPAVELADRICCEWELAGLRGAGKSVSLSPTHRAVLTEAAVAVLELSTRHVQRPAFAELLGMPDGTPLRASVPVLPS